MSIPFVSYLTFNRLGLTIRSLSSILDSSDNFELHIVDCNSKDDTWSYIESINDTRIASKIRLPINSGPIYGVNFNLSRRKPDQYFFTVDSDVVIKTKDWISRFMRIFSAFPEVGVLGTMRGDPYPQIYPPVVTKIKDGISYLELKNAKVDVPLDFVHGCMMGLRPELIKQIGFWSEENGYGDAELSPRVNQYTTYKAGFMTDKDFNPIIDIEMPQLTECGACLYKDKCRLDKGVSTCFTIHRKNYMNESFANKFKYKYLETFKELEEGKRSAYCTSIFDPDNAKYPYHHAWALENFAYYIQNSN